PLPAAWLARFGRAVAEQAIDGITDRLTAARTEGLQGSLAGVAFTPPRQPDAARASRVDTRPDNLGMPYAGLHDGVATGSSGAAQELLLNSAFTFTGGADNQGGSLAFWSRASASRFEGREDNLDLSGETTTALFGLDYARDRWLAGIALSWTDGKGDHSSALGALPAPNRLAPAGSVTDQYADDILSSAAEGDIDTSLLAAIPYAAYKVSDRLDVWGAAGHGIGELTLRPSPDERYQTDTSWSMAAAGLRSNLLHGINGATLAVVSDVLWTRTGSDEIEGLASSRSETSRVRMGLEGSYPFHFAGGRAIVPKLEAGLRRDAGAAESGFGVEIGGGISWSEPWLGLRLDLEGQGLITHADSSFGQRGFSAALAFDPRPASAYGLTFNLRQDIGALNQSGLDALFAAGPATVAHADARGGSRSSATAAYGLPAFDQRFVGTAHLGYGVSDAARDYTLGWRLTPAANGPELNLDLVATRREVSFGTAEHGFGLRMDYRW
ncbi:MAG: hypothetical protein OXD47_12075, partial [Gammaproteobacteria bacterium]|nr:hypothetical protein [Gammaproteobacteria bacterium]